jgi:hypothetical protein
MNPRDFARLRRAFGDASEKIASRPGVRSLCARRRRGRPAANYGDDFGLGEDRDPVIGNNRGSGRFVIPGDIRRREEPFICSGLPSFVTVKGGDYFFIPSLTALRLLAAGCIDRR